jgi:hypothetical protein
MPAVSSSCGQQDSGILGASYMHVGSRKCLLCNRRFPGEAFEKHERGSARHRGNLRDKEAVAKANERLKKIRGLELFGRKEVGPTSAAEDAFERKRIRQPPPQSYRQQSPDNNKASSPHYHSRDFSPTAPNSASPHGEFKRPNIKRSREESEDELLNRAPDEDDLRATEGDESPFLFKRQRHASEPQVGESCTQSKVRRLNRNARNAGAHDDVIVKASRAAFNKLFELHPGVFNLELNERIAPAPRRRQAMGPLNKPTSPKSMEEKGDCQRANVKKEIYGDESGAGVRGSSVMSCDYIRYPSRSDDPQDMDYIYEEDEMLAEDEGEDQEGDVEEEELLELLQR